MQYDRAKYRRLEQTATALRAVDEGLTEEIAEKSRVFHLVLNGVLSWLRNHHRIDVADRAGWDSELRKTGKDLVSLAEQDPAGFLAVIEKSGDLRILGSARDLANAHAAVQEARAAQDAHRSKMAQFSPAFARCREFVEKLAGYGASIPGAARAGSDVGVASDGGPGAARGQTVIGKLGAMADRLTMRARR